MQLDLHLWSQLAFGLILAGGLYLFISEKLRVDVTAMLIAAGAGADRRAGRRAGAVGIRQRAGDHRRRGVRDLGRTGRHRHHRAPRQLGRSAPPASSEWRAIAVVMPAGGAAGLVHPPRDGHRDDAADPAAARAQSPAAGLAPADADVAGGVAGHHPDPVQRAGLPAGQRHARARRRGGAGHLLDHADRRRAGAGGHRLHAADPLAAAQAQRRARTTTTTCAWTATAPSWWW